MIQRGILFFVVLVFLSACGMDKPQAATKEVTALPSWYMNPPASTDTTLYGVGEGVNKEDAIAHALANIVARLNVSISSSFSAKSVVHEGRTTSVDKVYVDNVRSEVQAIHVSNYETVAYKKLGFKRYGALVKVDKRAFAQSLKKEIQRDLFITKKTSSLTGVDALRQLAMYKKKLQKLQDIEYRLAVLSMLDTSVDERVYLKEYEALQNAYEHLRESISFWVYAPQQYASLAKPIQKGLSQEHFKIQKEKSPRHFTITLQADITQAKAYGFIIARANLTITTKESQGTIVASNTLSLVGRSAQSFEVAKQDLVKALNKRVEEEGIFKVLGLDI